MPSNLPVIKVRTNDENVIKMKFIAKHNERSVSKEIENLIENCISEFEKKHGEIEIYTMSPSEIAQDIQDRVVGNPPYGK